jgi:hypothetical protein
MSSGTGILPPQPQMILQSKTDKQRFFVSIVNLVIGNNFMLVTNVVKINNMDICLKTYTLLKAVDPLDYFTFWRNK